MNDLVKFHNNLNKIPFNSLNELERNIVMSMLVQVKEKGGDVIKYSVKDIKEAIKDRHLQNEQLINVINGLKNHFFNISFEVISKPDIQGRVYSDLCHLFNRFRTIYTDSTKSTVEYIELQVNPPFLYLVNDLVKDFTTFELMEFCAVKGKYAKDLYRILKQYKGTGMAIFAWEDFKKILCVPQNYPARDIEYKIIKPAIKELTRKLDLIDKACNRSAYQSIEYIKIKDEKARGKPIKLIKFIFDKEVKKQIPEDKKVQWRYDLYRKHKAEDQKKEDRARAYANKDELEVPEYIQDIPDGEWY